MSNSYIKKNWLKVIIQIILLSNITVGVVTANALDGNVLNGSFSSDANHKKIDLGSKTAPKQTNIHKQANVERAINASAEMQANFDENGFAIPAPGPMIEDANLIGVVTSINSR